MASRRGGTRWFRACDKTGPEGNRNSWCSYPGRPPCLASGLASVALASVTMPGDLEESAESIVAACTEALADSEANNNEPGVAADGLSVQRRYPDGSLLAKA
ncbi:MAG: hypothetical protein OSB19_14770 [Opitutaceae bacterium]|nr:hypothetical protein [Opitutaceae bacterium]